jgi:hypothetical protein
MTWGFPVTVVLAADVCAKFRAGFLRAFRVPLPSGMFLADLDRLWADERVVMADEPDELDAAWRAIGLGIVLQAPPSTADAGSGVPRCL